MIGIVYKVTIYRHDIWHQRYRFMGRRPTRDDVLEAIERHRGDSLRHKILITTEHSKEIVEHCGLPEEDGVLNPTQWFVVGKEAGSVSIEQETIWIIDQPTSEKTHV